MIHVHHRIDSDVRCLGGFLDFLRLSLIRFCRYLRDFEADVSRQFKAVRGAQLRGQHFEPDALLDSECWGKGRRRRGCRLRVGQCSMAETRCADGRSRGFQELATRWMTHKFTSVQFIQVEDRKSTRLNSSHTVISYAVFCLKKKT